MKTLPANHFRLWTRDIPENRQLYPGKLGERVPRTQTATWDRRVVTGPVSADAESLISSWTQDDYSGGFGIKDGNESVDTSRIAFGVIDPRRPKSMCLPPLTSEPSLPTGMTGSAWPLGDIGENFYVGWAGGIFGWDNDAQDWHVTENEWPADFVPVNEPVAFAGAVFVPGGAEGTVILTEQTAATGDLNVTALTGVTAVVFGLHDDKLWAIDTDNHLWMLTALGAFAGASTLGNWGTVNATAGYTGTELQDTFGNSIKLNAGVTPTTLLNWFNNAQEPTLWCVTRGQGAFMLNPDEPRWIQATIKPGTHPNWGIDAEVFRDGEDMFICGGGLDLTRLTVNAEVPLSGPGKDQGVPPQYQGTIVDLLSERSTLYALVQAGTSVAAGSPTSTWVLQDTIGNLGSATGQFNTPQQVAVDSSGNFYVADYANDRVQKFTSAGVFVSHFISSIDDPTGICIDSSDNVYISYKHGTDLYRVRKYNSSGTLQWTSGIATDDPLHHLTTDSTTLFAVDSVDSKVYQLPCTTGTGTTNFGSPGSGDGQFNTPIGIATDGTHLYVADTGNNRVQKFTTAGVYVTKWGTLGTGTSNLNAPEGVAMDASGDVWVCDYGNSRLQRFSNTGTYQTTITQSTPKGIAATSGDILYVSSGQNNVAIWDEETVTTPAIASKTWLGAWTGTAWCALWESEESIVPTWMKLSLKGDYALWWGDDDGVVYRQLLPDPFFNPSARVELGVYPFAATGWMETTRYDANMGGWDKIASHFFAMMQYASASEYVDIYYRTDADQWTSGEQDPDWRAWKRVDHIGRTLCRFDDTEVDPITGDTWREGEPFQWIQFRYEFFRGSDTYKSPIWMWHSLHHMAVPQDASSLVLKVPLPQKSGNSKNRSPDEMVETLMDLQTTRKMVHLQTRNPNPDHPEWQVFYRGRVTQVKSEFFLGKDNNLAEVVVINFIEIGESSNLYTTLAVDIPA
jgi:hypothetical protein